MWASVAAASSSVWRCGWQPTVGALILGPLNGTNFLVDQQQIRGRKRFRNKQTSKAEKLRKKQIKEEKEARRRQFSFIERMKMRVHSGKSSFSLQWPGRYDEVADQKKDLKEVHGIYLVGHMRTRFHPLTEALEMYRRHATSGAGAGIASSDMLLKLRIELNMGTEKATKFVSDSRQLIVLPHPFKHREKRTILAFASTKELQQEAMTAGADIALGPEMVKKILKGQFVIDDYDFCVAQADMGPHITSLRGVIKTRYPTRANGGLGEDVVDIVKKFLSGINLVVRRDPTNELWGLSEPLIGRLNQSNEELEANVAHVVGTICKQRSPALGKFINRACLMPAVEGNATSRTFYPIDVSQWEPEATEEDITRLEKRQNKRKKKKAKKTVEVDDSDSVLLGLLGEDEKIEGGEEEEKETAEEEKKKEHPLANLEKLDKKLLLEVM